jgi:hypothetical protein
MEPDAVTPMLDNLVRGRLRAVAARLRRYILLEGVTSVIVFLMAGAFFQWFVDYTARGMRWSMRAAALAAIIAGAAWLVWRRVITPLRVRFGSAEVANLVERRYPELSSLLISAVRFAGGEVGPSTVNSPALVASVVERTERSVRSLDFNVVLDPRRARRAGFSLVIVLILCVAATAGAPETVGLWFARNVLLQEVEWPKRTHLIVELDGDELIGARGDDLVVQAHAQGVQPRTVEIIFQTVGGKRGRETMVTVGGEGSYRYRYTFKNAQEDFTFHLEGGDDRTGTFSARLLERPRVTWTEMRIVLPAYTGLEAFTLGDDQRAAQVLPGSRVTIRFETNKPVTRATLMAGREALAEASPQGRRYSAEVSPTESHTYHFALVDEVGLDNRRPVRFSLRVILDEPPSARLKLRGAGNMITPQAVLPIKVEYADTYGLATAELLVQTSREESNENSIPLPEFNPPVTSFSTSLTWPVATAAIAPGETLTLFARATDLDDVSGPNEAQSQEKTLRVVTREELMAELARREQEYRADFERLVDSQERLRGALLTVLGRVQKSEDTGEALAGELAPLERRQRNIAGSVNVIRQQFEQILAELSVNQLDTLDELQRLGDRIVGPLTQLAKRDLVAAADTVRQWSRDASTDKALLVDPQQVALLSQMRHVLANMIQWEGYQEVVNMLHDIIRLQQELRSETQETLEEQADDVFED